MPDSKPLSGPVTDLRPCHRLQPGFTDVDHVGHQFDLTDRTTLSRTPIRYGQVFASSELRSVRDGDFRRHR